MLEILILLKEKAGSNCFFGPYTVTKEVERFIWEGGGTNDNKALVAKQIAMLEHDHPRFKLVQLSDELSPRCQAVKIVAEGAAELYLPCCEIKAEDARNRNFRLVVVLDGEWLASFPIETETRGIRVV